MHSFAAVWEGIANVFTNFEWTFILDAILFFLIIYFVFKTLAENGAKKLVALYVILLVMLGAIVLFSARIASQYFYFFMMIESMFFLLLYQTEIKRSVSKTARIGGKPAMKASPLASNKGSAVRAEGNISGIVKAVQSLSKANIGALIVLSNGNLPRGIIESGVLLDSDISNQLIEGIFIPKAPLHDGAMIINGDKIQAAGCFLPLTQKDFPKDYGTRHRAGIGVTEVADVSAIIVSEETGIVSVVKRGEITRYVDSESLKRFLRDYYWKDYNVEGKAK